MKRIFRKDFYIDANNDMLKEKKKKNEKISFSINQAQAVYLSLFNGLCEDSEIEKIALELFGDNIKKLVPMERFLLPVEYAFDIFGHYVHPYLPEGFLKKKYNMPNDFNKDIIIPRYLTLCLTHKCYRKCAYCYAHAEKSKVIEHNALNIKEYQNVLMEAFDMAIEGVLLTGGEPLLYPNVYDIIDFLCSHGIRTQVLTKYPLNEKRLRMIDTRFLDICLSIDTYDPKLANYLTGSSSFFEDMRNNFLILNKMQIAFNATIVITKLNISQILDTVQFLLKSGAKHVFTNYYSYDNDQVDELVLSEEEKKDFNREISIFINNSKLNGYVTHNEHNKNSIDILQMNCAGLHKKVTIDYDGKYLICDHARDIHTEFKNVKTHTIIEHFNSKTMEMYRYPQREKYKGTKCEKCKFFEKCAAKNSCYVKSFAEHNELYRPLKEIEDVCNKG